MVKLPFRLRSKILAVVFSWVSPKTSFEVFGSSVMRSMSFLDILMIRGLLCFIEVFCRARNVLSSIIFRVKTCERTEKTGCGRCFTLS